ncbi:MAG TPA: glycosyltransferase family 2 protein, partial [Gammaproteobacteria bacterium]|nr:glycosyltransferase family 2 protein [Gammaproteobacteria bacterium]
MRKLPLVSVVITTYGQERYVGRTVESVLSQGIDDMEVIVLDDCSPDATSDVIAPYLEDPRLSYVRHP